MKRIYIFVLFFTMAVISASAQITAVFDRYADTKGVTSVYISKAMFRMMGDLKTSGMDLNGFGDKLDAIRILNTERPKLAEKMSSEVSREVKKEGYEILMLANDDGDRTTIYQRTDKAGVNHYLIVAQEPSELSIISIEGSITPADIKNMNDKSKK